MLETASCPAEPLTKVTVPAVETDQFHERIAANIGAGADPKHIQDIVDWSNRSGVAFHGVKRAEYIESVRDHGVEPRSPEGRGQDDVSFWTTGRRFFSSGNGHVNAGQDTTFFHYGHSHAPTYEGSIMTIAVIHRDTVRKCLGQDIPFEPDAHIEIPYAIPPEAMELLQVEVMSTSEHTENTGQIAQRKMLELLHGLSQARNS